MRHRAAAIVAAAAMMLAGLTPAAMSSQPVQGIGAYDQEGWSVLRPSADTKFIFVSSSLGDDSNDGLSPERPKRTIDNARRTVRNGRPDWVLLRRGDTWVEEFRWSGNGRSLEEPMVVGAYGDGTARPVVQAPSGKNGFFIGTTSLRFLAITGIEFRAPAAGSGHSGIRIVADTGEGLLIEGCLISGFKDNFSLISDRGRGGFDTVQIRRNVVVDSAAPFGGHSQGLFADALDNLVIEENVFDHNGWRADGTVSPTIFNHNVYLQSTCGPAVVRGNIIASGASHGLQMRPGGTAEDNLFVRNALAMFTSREDSTIRRNVVLEGRDLDATNPRGFGIEIKPIVAGVVEQNIVAHRAATSASGYAFQLHNSDTGITDFNVAIRENIVYRWGDVALNVRHPDLGIYNRIVVEGNTFVAAGPSAMVRFSPPSFDPQRFEFSGNGYRSGSSASAWFSIGGSPMGLPGWQAETSEWNAAVIAPQFPDPDRSVGSYYRDEIGGQGGYAEFMERARSLSRGNWDRRFTAAAVNAYIREGFGLDP